MESKAGIPGNDWERYAGLRASYSAEIGLRDVCRETVAGRSLLHVGCRDGGLCLEAARAGAARVAGVDVDPVYIDRARNRAKEEQLRVDFLCASDLDALPFDHEFDIVLCPEDLDSQADPIRFLKELSRLTGDFLVVGVRFGTPDVVRKRLGTRMPVWLMKWLETLPASFFLSKQPMHRGQVSISPNAVREILLTSTHRFLDAQVVKADEPLQKLVCAPRRKGNNLVVVAGPDAAGKSRAAAKIMSGGAAEVCRGLKLNAVSHWHLTDTHGLRDLPGFHLDNVVMEYNLLNPLKGALRSSSRDPTLRFLGNFEKVYVITLWVEPETLRRRLLKRLESPVVGKRLINAERVFNFYQSDDLVREVYRRWVDVCDGLDLTDHWIVRAGDGYQDYCAPDALHIMMTGSRAAVE